MNKYRGLYTFDTDNHRYVPLVSANGIVDLLDTDDYEPTEPLIKDDKIRKAVKAWSEANELEPDFEVRYSENSFTLISWQASIEFNAKISGLEHDKKYSITELCGEEEE